MTWLAVMVGGGLGAVARHAMAGAILRAWPAAPAFTAIFAINIAGSAAIGMIAGALATSRLDLSHEARLFVTVGVLGGFTTFSSFSLDTLTLIKGGQIGWAVANALGQVATGTLAAAIGYRVAS
jgi:CrcB protein